MNVRGSRMEWDRAERLLDEASDLSAQAAELQDVVLAVLDGITVLAGDLNSDAAANPGDPSWTPTYGDLDQRLDFVLVRASSPRVQHWLAKPPALDAEVVGEESGDLTPGGMWPSDHAGVVGTVWIPRGVR